MHLSKNLLTKLCHLYIVCVSIPKGKEGNYDAELKSEVQRLIIKLGSFGSSGK